MVDETLEEMEKPAPLRLEDEVPWRVGLDLGRRETRIVLPGADGTPDARVRSFPTVLAYSREEARPIRFSCVGERALARRDHLRLVNPLTAPAEGRSEVLSDFARHLRELLGKGSPGTPWGVVNCSVGASAEERTIKRSIANQLFDRVVLADDTFLLALGLGSQEVSSHSIIIDVGATSTRVALMHGEAPRPEERFEVPVGGVRVEEALRAALALRYPELLLTGWTLTAMKESLSFFPPARRRALLRIRFRGAEKTVDVTEAVGEAMASLLRPLLKATRAVLAKCPSDEIEAFQRNIIIAGGGALIPGLVQKVEEELCADGFELARVRRPENATQLVARGACRWAQHLPEKEWSIPLFSFAGG